MNVWHLRGLVLPDDVERDVYVVDGRLTFTAPDQPTTTLATDVYLLPGLVDVHAHLALFSPAGDGATSEERVRASAGAHLEAGVLAVREPGSPDHSSRGLGPHEGLPRVSTAGRFLAPPGRYFPGLAREVTDEQLPDAAVEEHEASGAWVKLIGDSPFPGPGITTTFGAEPVAEVVRRVHELGGRVAIHCSLPEVVDAALAAGVDSLEHATFLQSDQVAALAASGAAWVPTCSINEAIRQLTTPSQAALIDHQADAIARAAEAGVPILAGTDAGMGPHGLVRYEISLLRGAGLSPAVALGAGSWTARSFLGLPGIEEGAVADLTAYRDDPRRSPDVLASPTSVVLDGTPVRRSA
jgi:imidazolonepropionase-like amidohydrolase